VSIPRTRGRRCQGRSEVAALRQFGIRRVAGVTLLASRLDGHARIQISTSAWYHKQRPTFADSLAAVRRAIWSEQGFAVSRQSIDAAKLPPVLREGIAYALCHAA
jgi:hypothetical protein